MMEVGHFCDTCPHMEPPLNFQVSTNVQYWSLQDLSNAILAVKEVFFFWGGALHKNVLCKVCTSHNEGLSKKCMSQNTMTAMCKLKHGWTPILALWQTLPNSNNSCNFNYATSTRHWLQLQLGNTTICKHGFFNHNWVKSDRKSQLKPQTLDALMRVSLCSILMENTDWAKTSDTWKSTKSRRALPLELDDH